MLAKKRQTESLFRVSVSIGSLVSWSGGKKGLLLGAKEGAGFRVNFAQQTGVYVLYQWPELRYVGRATSSLFDRLRIHHRTRPHWDKFSWFGLRPIDTDGELGTPRDQASVEEKAMAMEGFLLSVLKPPENMKGGDLLGDEYFQVADALKQVTTRQGR